MICQMQKKVKGFGEILSAEKGHNREAEWLTGLKNDLENEEHLQESVITSVQKVIKQCRKMPNWKPSGKDGVQGYWIKNLNNLHDGIASQMNKILMGEDSSTCGRTVLC